MAESPQWNCDYKLFAKSNMSNVRQIAIMPAVISITNIKKKIPENEDI